MKKLVLGLLAYTMLSTVSLIAMIGYDECYSRKVENMLADLDKFGDSDKFYLDEDEMQSSEDAFYIHLGNNVWIQTNSVNKDKKGLYTYRAAIARTMINGNAASYEKKWKCPYCYNYWPVGKSCQNKDCPSKYRD